MKILLKFTLIELLVVTSMNFFSPETLFCAMKHNNIIPHKFDLSRVYILVQLHHNK
ncbi:MAG: hypothetical protein IJW31_02120 [Lentisphaeria bacterium]|nr:hypothetical protein [Lentisphaeria bacterium]